MNVLVIKTDNSVEIVDVKPTLEWMQQIVEGYIERFSGIGCWHAYCNEDGKMLELPINVLATALASKLGWNHDNDVIVGNAIFFGDLDGKEESVPNFVTETLDKLLVG